MAKVYIAGASREPERLDAFFDAVLAQGHTITCDWREEQRAHAGVREADLPVAVRQQAAAKDLAGVREAELLIVLMPPDEIASRGLWVELGSAAGLRFVGTQPAPRIWCVGRNAMASIFTEIADERFFSEEAALMWLAQSCPVSADAQAEKW